MLFLVVFSASKDGAGRRPSTLAAYLQKMKAKIETKLVSERRFPANYL
jgi:hypothetical protein